MNYLAHLHLATLTDTSLLGAFLGDFVKGNAYREWPEEVALGIILHRKIDTFTDAHPVNKAMRAEFPKSLRRMAGVVMDIYFDHLLATNLIEERDNDIHFLSRFYEELASASIADHQHFLRLQKSLLQERWLLNYRHEKTCITAFYAIEKRLQGRIRFAADAALFVQSHKQSLTHTFNCFYPQLTGFAADCAASLAKLNTSPH